MIGPFGKQGPAATLTQHCPQMTRRRCIVFRMPTIKLLCEGDGSLKEFVVYFVRIQKAEADAADGPRQKVPRQAARQA